MSYKDDQLQHDNGNHGPRDYEKTESSSQQSASTKTTSSSSSSTSRKGLLSRMRDALTGGVSNAGKNAKKGYNAWKSEGGIFSQGLGGVVKFLANPKKLGIFASILGIGGFSIFNIFSTYKNEDVIKNEVPLSCESGYVTYYKHADVYQNVKQETVDMMYDVFVKNYGYSEEFLAGMLSCMMTECDLNYSNIERDWSAPEGVSDAEWNGPNGQKQNLDQRYNLFYSIAGGGDFEVLDTNPTTQEVLDAYHTYSDVMHGNWEPVDNDFYTCTYNGRKGVGIGLIGWTGDNGVDFLMSVDKIYQNYDWYDLQYQCAYILAGFKKDSDSTMQDGKWRVDMQTIMTDYFEVNGTDSEGKPVFKYTGQVHPNSPRSKDGVDMDKIPEEQLGMFAATKWYFEKYVNGGPSDTQKFNYIIDRWKNVPKIQEMINNAKVRSRYSADVSSMVDLIYTNTINETVYENQNANICQNDTVIDTVSVAMSAASISWLEKGDYENDQAAYGHYKRSPTSPDVVNDWDFLETLNNKNKATAKDHIVGQYDSGRLKGLDKYDVGTDKGVKNCTCKGENHDLIACTEFYYNAHLVAFPKETGVDSSHGGYFSSCDRGTGTAVRISGADDAFPAGNPNHQLEYVLGANINSIYQNISTNDRHKQLNGQNQKLWKATGFLRGCDWYSFEGKDGITPGNIMISWSSAYANGFGEKGDWQIKNVGDEINLRFLFSHTSTQRHIITYTGDATVRAHWGIDFLLQQFDLYTEDADCLVRGDLTIQAPEVMQKGADIKARYAKDAFNNNITFYTAQQEHANDKNSALSEGGNTATSLITQRIDTQYNQKTGLPEFRSWEQIFMRLTHNTDDGGKSQSYGIEKDGFYDNDDEVDDHIVQYGDYTISTKANTYFTKDWNSAGSDSVDMYEDATDAKWYDKGDDKWTNAFLKGNVNYYWRYEIAADAEYRTNQLERFSMAGFMCSYASEADANIYQNNENKDNADFSSGHILGNVYRRMARISDKSDVSGHYYYYNTVVSNDMLQDLVQLYNTEGPDKHQIEEGKNFGPYYNLSDVMSGAASRVNANHIGDRRYGLTYYDVQNIFDGFAREDNANEQYGWGTDGYDPDSDTSRSMQFGVVKDEEGSFSNRMYKYMTTPAYNLEQFIENYGTGVDGGSYNVDVEKSDQKDVYYGISEDNGQEKVVMQELYGINPYLMIKEYEASTALGTNRSDKPEEDKWMSFIDRHYYSDQYGNINMWAYAVLGMNPTAGKWSGDNYESDLSEVETLKTNDCESIADAWKKLRYRDYIYGADVTNSNEMGDRLFGDDKRDDNDLRDDYNRREYIVIPYYHTHSQYCKYNPGNDPVNYYKHSSYLAAEVRDNPNGTGKMCLYELDCPWTGNHYKLNGEQDYVTNNMGTENANLDLEKLDTQVVLNFTCDDAVNTLSFAQDTLLRNKYTEKIEELAARGGYTVKYYDENGVEINPDATPPIHKLCPGYTTYAPEHLDDCMTNGGTISCSQDSPCTQEECGWICCDKMLSPYSGSCHHECTEEQPDSPTCLSMEAGLPGTRVGSVSELHTHYECDGHIEDYIEYDFENAENDNFASDSAWKKFGSTSKPGEDGTTDVCHAVFGCNILEYYYHTGKPVYMMLQIVDDPVEEWGVDISINDWIVDGKVKSDAANILQQIEYDEFGYISSTWYDQLKTLANPGSCDDLKQAPAHYDNSSWASGYATNLNYKYQPGINGLIGYFTIEGHVVTDEFNKRGAEITSSKSKEQCGKELSLLESVRNRVGDGKTGVTIENGQIIQHSTPKDSDGLWDITKLSSVDYDNTSRDGGTTPNGYGEIIITGAAHGASPMPKDNAQIDTDNMMIDTALENYAEIFGSYGDPNNGGGSGPDTALGNEELEFGNSLIRYLLGDEHVYHVRIGSQDKDVITGDDSVYQFEYFDEFVDVDSDAVYIDSETGRLTMNEYSAYADVDKDVEFGELKSNQDNDGYGSLAEYYKNTPLSIKTWTTTPKSLGTTGPSAAELQQRYIDEGIKGQDEGLNGDYGVWISHASRGDRGMKTQYLVLKNWFGDPYDGEYDTPNMMYMTFEAVMQKDEDDVDKDGDKEEPYIYKNAPGDAVVPADFDGIDKVIYGQGSNSRWRLLIELQNETERNKH